MPVGNLSLPLGSVLTGQPEVIGSSVLSAAASSVSFQFPPVYRAVLVEAFIKKDATGGDIVRVNLNNDFGLNYSMQFVSGNDATITGQRQTGARRWNVAPSNIAANERDGISFLVAKTTAAAKGQCVLINANGSFGSGNAGELHLFGGEWNNTADLLSRIDVNTLGGNFAANTSITLWGYRL